MIQKKQKIFNILSEPIKVAGFELIEVKVSKSNTQETIQIFIDKPGGVQIDDCVIVNQITIRIFEKYNQNFKNYALEVSSPGIFRKLKTPDHFKSSTGKRIKVNFQKKIKGLMTVTGNLQKCDEETIRIVLDSKGSDMIIPYSLITKANLEPLLNV